MMKLLKAFFIFIIFLSITLNSNAQTGNPSVYSNFGIGRINSGGNVKNEGFGGSGIALGSRTYINALNPASLCYIDTLNMHIDVGVGGGYTFYKTTDDDGTSYYGGLSNVTLAMRTSRWSGISFGFDQYSYVGYNINSYVGITGSTETVYKSSTGDGGVNEVFLSYGFRIGKHLSLGAKGSLLFGTIEKSETYVGSNIGGSLLVKYTDYLHALKGMGGLQYKFKINKYRLGLGATYSPAIRFTTDRDVLASATSGAGVSEELDDNYYKLPDSYAGGFSLSNSKGLSFVLDAKYEPWSDIYYADSKTDLQDSYRVSGGAEYFNINTEKSMPFVWQFGAYGEKTYLNVAGRSIIDRGFSVGIGIPLKPKTVYDGSGFVNVVFNAGQRGTWNNDLITENYLNLKVSVSLIEIWFMKRQLE